MQWPIQQFWWNDLHNKVLFMWFKSRKNDLISRNYDLLNLVITTSHLVITTFYRNYDFLNLVITTFYLIKTTFYLVVTTF